MCKRDVIYWNALIVGFAQCGRDVEALSLFKEMLLAGMNPSSISFVNVLLACAHMEVVREGQ
jgi:pentatricopeptide repeat protein